MTDRPRDSSYDDLDFIASRVAAGQHRAVVGGMWEEIGRLQLDFMRAHGLQAGDRLIDLGCGSLRGGVRFVGYLDPGNYHGLDSNQSLLEAGYRVELSSAGLQDRLPRRNLFCNSEFVLPVEDGFFDAGIAQSLFSHLSFNSIRLCLETVAPKFRVGAKLFATYFELAPDQPASRDLVRDPGGVVTHGHMDPYHYRPGDLVQAAVGAPWRAFNLGQWGHPRAQSMMAFERI